MKSPQGRLFSTLPLKMMNGKVGKSAMFTSHWLLSQKQSTSDLYLMQRIIPKHISICHCWWCPFSMSLQHSILRSTEDAEPFHTFISLSQLAPETFRAGATGELHNCKEMNLKTFRLNMPCTCSLGGIWVCDAVMPFNNYPLWTVQCSTPLPPHTAADSPQWALVLAHKGNKPVQEAKPAEKQPYKKATPSFLLWLYFPKLAFWQVRWILLLQQGRKQKHTKEAGNQDCPFWNGVSARC